MTASHDPTDHLLSALAGIERAAAGNLDRTRELLDRARTLRRRLAAGDNIVDLVAGESPPRMVELLSTNMATLETAGAEFRAAEAIALRAEGLTIEAIAELFGVTRQRISALLRQKAAVSVIESSERPSQP
jgi:transcriptional regulator